MRLATVVAAADEASSVSALLASAVAEVAAEAED
jgi:hypothetical protein